MASRCAVTTATAGAPCTAAKPSSSRRKVEVPGGATTNGVVARVARSISAPSACVGPRGQDQHERLATERVRLQRLGDVAGVGHP